MPLFFLSVLSVLHVAFCSVQLLHECGEVKRSLCARFSVVKYKWKGELEIPGKNGSGRAAAAILCVVLG